MKRAVILVPRRAGFVDRDLLWGWVRDWWQRELPEFEIFEGLHETGEFNRSCAINRAAGLADWQREQPWDVAIIIDADVICDPTRVRQAVTIAIARNRMVMPFNRRCDLDRAGSLKIQSGYRGSWEPFIRKVYTEMVSSVNVVTRQLWNDTGGYDEGFSGWGFEDNAFDVQTSTFATPDPITKESTAIKLPGEVWHFFHVPAKEGKRGTATHGRNKARADRYLLARGNKEAVRALRYSAPPAFEHRPYGIPRILHRTVPQSAIGRAEKFWMDWGKLLPGWELMTHVDPLDPSQWPETSRKWSECANGAQMAGLIRLEALWRWGGVYVDQDVQPFRSLEPLLPLSAFAAWEDERVIPDAVIAAVPGHPAIRQCLDLALSRVPGDTWKSGPGVLTEIFRKHEQVTVLPPESFYPVHYKVMDSIRQQEMDNYALNPKPWSFALHRYWGSWLEPERQRVGK